MQFNNFSTFVEIGDKYDSVTYTKGSIKSYWFPNKLEYRFWEGRSASLLWSDVDYTKVLNNFHRDFSKLYLLIQRIDRRNVIVNSSGKPIYTNKDLAELIELKYNRYNKQFFKEICDKGIIKKDKERKLVYMSPFIAMRKPRLYIGCYQMFREELYPTLTTKQRNDLEKHLKECTEAKMV